MAARTSPDFRVGQLFKMSASEIPSARLSRITVTMIRVPAIQTSPRQPSGLALIHSCLLMTRLT